MLWIKNTAFLAKLKMIKKKTHHGEKVGRAGISVGILSCSHTTTKIQPSFLNTLRDRPSHNFRASQSVELYIKYADLLILRL